LRIKGDEIILTNLKYKNLYAVLISLFIVLANSITLFAAEVTLSWSPPITNEDGSALTDLDGFIVSIGTEPGMYFHTVDVGNAASYEFVMQHPMNSHP
jgi:hypothetical protein